jgi:hypothetical protein
VFSVFSAVNKNKFVVFRSYRFKIADFQVRAVNKKNKFLVCFQIGDVKTSVSMHSV